MFWTGLLRASSLELTWHADHGAALQPARAVSALMQTVSSERFRHARRPLVQSLEHYRGQSLAGSATPERFTCASPTTRSPVEVSAPAKKEPYRSRG